MKIVPPLSITGVEITTDPPKTTIHARHYEIQLTSYRTSSGGVSSVRGILPELY